MSNPMIKINNTKDHQNASNGMNDQQDMNEEHDKQDTNDENDKNYKNYKNYVNDGDDRNDGDGRNDGNDEISSPLIVSPPYWQTNIDISITSDQRKRLRSDSDLNDGRIQLNDNTDEENQSYQSCWAKSSKIPKWIVVGSLKGFGKVGSYIVYDCEIEMTNGSKLQIKKRYSQFESLCQNLIKTFPNSKGALPTLPPKSITSKFDDKFLEKRRDKLEYFFNCILLNPEFSSSPILKDFVFSND